MSKDVESSFSPLSSSTSTPGALNVSSVHNSSYPGAPLRQSSSSQAGPSTWRPPSHWNINGTSTSPSFPKKTLRKATRTAEEEQIISDTAARVASRLGADHAATLLPDVDTPFSSVEDATDRLLPYHIYLQPKEDLRPLIPTSNRKGKTKAAESDEQEIQETRFALECFRRRRKLQERFRKARVKMGNGSYLNEQAIALSQGVLDADRADLALLTSELRAARSELEKLDRAKRAAANPPPPPRPYYIAQSQPPVVNGQPTYYRYPYSYGQYAVATTAIPPAPTFSVASTPPSSTATPSQPATYAPVQTGAAIPVQLPVSSIPALNQLGIIPVPAASVPSDGQPPPPAVLRGSSANGTMVNLEINVSLLQSAQMSGLALILNSLMSRTSASSTGGGVAATTGTGTFVNSSVATTSETSQPASNAS